MVKFDPKIHHRRSIRLKGYDYSQAGAYYVTIVAWHREFLFGEIVNKEMDLNKVRGDSLKGNGGNCQVDFLNVELGASVVMPNHFHGIFFILEKVGATSRVKQGRTQT